MGEGGRYRVTPIGDGERVAVLIENTQTGVRVRGPVRAELAAAETAAWALMTTAENVGG